jgi:RNA polymerase sigma-70 factor (ECF subfamily)
MNDNELIQQIRQGGYPMEKCLEFFYKDNIRFIGLMQKRFGLSRESLLDAYSDAIIDFKEQVRNHQFQQKSKCSTYFFSIYNNKCIDILRKKTTYTITNEIPENLKDTAPDIVQMLTITVERDYLEKIIARLSAGCKDILMDWNDGYSMEDIAQRNHLLNAHVARSKRYACLQQLLVLAGRSNMVADKGFNNP